MIKFKVFDVNEYDYEEQMEQFQTEFPQAEFLQITGGHMGPEKIWFKYESSANNVSTDELSVEKLQEENKKLRNEIARLSNQTQVDYRGAYEESQEQLNTAKKALSEIAEFDCCDDCYSTAYEALMEIDEEFQKNISKANKFIEEAKKRLEGSGDE